MSIPANRTAILSLALALFAWVFAKPAHAVELGHLGVGDVLLFPYFTVQSERAAPPSADAWPYATLLTITNESDRIKAARVRFHDGRLGRQVYETVVYLSPRDTWVGAILRTGDGAGLVTPDASCTDPAVSKDENNPTLFGLDPISGLVLIPADQTREGHIEVFQMGDYGSGIDAPLGSVTAAVMPVGPGRMPRDCGRVHGDNGSESVVMPGSLSGSAVQINVSTGIEFSQRATALRNFNTERTLWFNPADGRPSLADAAPATSVIHDPMLGTVRTQWESRSMRSPPS
jgi:hypothetical protein